ncbi:MAG: DUF1611 domain-containing protein [Candidatus Competibacteraceae bacterium]
MRCRISAVGSRAWVILQHAPGREFFEGYEAHGHRIPPVEDEIQLIRCYGARTLAVTLQGKGMAPEALLQAQRDLQRRLDIPVVCPLEEGWMRWSRSCGNISIRSVYENRPYR